MVDFRWLTCDGLYGRYLKRSAKNTQQCHQLILGLSAHRLRSSGSSVSPSHNSLCVTLSDRIVRNIFRPPSLKAEKKNPGKDHARHNLAVKRAATRRVFSGLDHENDR